MYTPAGFSRALLVVTLLGLGAGACVPANPSRMSPPARPGTTLEHIEPSVPLVHQLKKLSGVIITRYGEIRIRGANGPPLLIVDGTQMGTSDLGFLNPSNIKRIELLKGPHTAMYGIRGGRGVLKITTKQGPDDY